MGRSAIFEGLWSAMQADTALIPLLGGLTPTNRRLYRSFPQLQSFLKGPPLYEPREMEGWLVLEEAEPGINQSRAQYDSIMEILDIHMHIFATTYGLADDVTDVLDDLFHWSIESQRDVQYGEYFVFFSRAMQSGEEYAEDIKLCHKTRLYRFELVEAEQIP